ncbi:peptidylprolyl isomerase [Plakobranchus ocellatus]|uniref:peptidylprolyl isomerase n=1 Tax=Plakobranchus ocellatus TaxID=259542 RepID=A0AAV3ZCV8_9GAST|nr:peptidylprolyl isomerase [Plakobranchus ocellatus]
MYSKHNASTLTAPNNKKKSQSLYMSSQLEETGLLSSMLVSRADPNKSDKKLQIGIKKRVDPDKCKIKTRKADILHMHYTGKLEDGTEFDSSHSRNEPFVFTLGTGQVIKGWDQGLLNMCEEEKRKLVIPPELGYGQRGAPPKIPGGATLVFEVELIKIERKEEL